MATDLQIGIFNDLVNNIQIELKGSVEVSLTPQENERITHCGEHNIAKEDRKTPAQSRPSAGAIRDVFNRQVKFPQLDTLDCLVKFYTVLLREKYGPGSPSYLDWNDYYTKRTEQIRVSNSKLPALPDEVRYKELYNMADEAFRRNDFQAAIKMYEAIRLFTDDPVVRERIHISKAMYEIQLSDILVTEYKKKGDELFERADYLNAMHQYIHAYELKPQPDFLIMQRKCLDHLVNDPEKRVKKNS